MKRCWPCLWIACWLAPAWSDTMRCEGMGQSGMVQEGDTKQEVLTICGKPDTREKAGTISRGVRVGPYSQRVTVPLEQWTYDCGYGRFSKLITFEASRVVRIESGERGNGGYPRCF